MFPPQVKLDLITSGDELLIGIRVNSHIALIGEKLGLYGLSIRQQITCRDGIQATRTAFEQCLNNGADVIIITGGIGPTSDDLTREAICESLGLSMHFDDSVLESIRQRFARMGREVKENNRRQCYVPDGAETLPNPWGTAPGLFLKHGSVAIFMLPGPTQELEPMLVEQVIPKLCSSGVCSIDRSYLQLRTAGVGESVIESRIKPITDRFPGLDVAYCAHMGIVDVRLSSMSGVIKSREIRQIAEECRRELGPDFCVYGNDSLAKIVFDILRSNEHTLAVAESCTGGLLANAFTDIPGASKVFMGGVVCYNNDAKVQMLGVPECIIAQHGAVSGECAAAMADGAADRFATDYAISVTGFAGPTGGTSENPVGTIFIGYHSPIGTWSVRVVKPGNRMQVKQNAVNHSLDTMRRKLNKYRVAEAMASMANAS